LSCSVLVEGTACEQDEDERDDDLVLGLGFDLAFGVNGETGDGVSSGDGGLNVKSKPRVPARAKVASQRFLHWRSAWPHLLVTHNSFGCIF